MFFAGCIHLNPVPICIGAAIAGNMAPNRARLASLTQQLQLIGIDAATSLHYGVVRAHLDRQGTPIGANDTWIAAQALAIKAVLVTDNEREFSHVPNLQLEHWLVR